MNPAPQIQPVPLRRAQIKRPPSFSFLLIVGVILVFIVCLISGGLYLYHSYTKKQLESVKAEIAEFDKQVNSEDAQQMFRVDKVLSSVENIMKQHPRVTPVFSVLEERTLPTVRYSGFAYDSRKQTIALTAVAKTDLAFAEQLEVYRQTAQIADMDFSNLTLKEDDSVEFAVTLTISETALPPIGSNEL